MDFTLTAEQSLLQDSVRRSLAQAGERRGPRSRRAIVDLGLPALPLSEDIGGLGGRPLEVALVAGEMGRALSADPRFQAAVQVAPLLAALGTGDELPAAIAGGEALVVLAGLEAAGRGDITFVEATARKTADGFALSGAKSVVLGAAEATVLLVTAKSADEAFPGIGVFRVEREAAAQFLRACQTIDGFEAADLVMQDLAVPASALVGIDCADLLRDASDAAVTALCGEALGAMEAAFYVTLDYLKTRHQFGVAIGSFQALQHRMADRFVDLEQARSMLYRLVGAQSESVAERRRAVSAAKFFIGRLGKTLGADMIQLHGGIGMTEEHVVGHYYRRLLAIDGRFGDEDYHLALLAA